MTETLDRMNRLAFTLQLKNRLTDKTLEARFFVPTIKEYIGKTGDQNYKYWNCRFITKKGKVVRDRSASSETWIGALLLAVEGVRRMIPEAQEKDWQTDQQLPSWVIFPKSVTIGWGYEFHQRLWRMVKTEERKLNKSIGQKRRKSR